MTKDTVEIGMRVIYKPSYGDAEEGTVTSFNDRYVFVRYGAKLHSEATAYKDLEAVYNG